MLPNHTLRNVAVCRNDTRFTLDCWGQVNEFDWLYTITFGYATCKISVYVSGDCDYCLLESDVVQYGK